MLEQFFKLQWIEQKEHSFFIGALYAIISLIAAFFILPSFTGIASLALTSALLIPTLNMLLSEEENVEIREKKFNIVQLFSDHKDIIKVYLSLFLGVFFVYLCVPLFFGIEFTQVFFSDLLQITGLVGHATEQSTFWSILWNNALVFLVVFILSLIYGSGSIFYLTLNAGVWGVFFGFIIRQDTLLYSITHFPLMIPHIIIEALAYIFIAISGGVLSTAVLREEIGSKKFYHVFTDALILFGLGLLFVIIGAFVEIVASTLL